MLVLLSPWCVYMYVMCVRKKVRDTEREHFIVIFSFQSFETTPYPN